MTTIIIFSNIIMMQDALTANHWIFLELSQILSILFLDYMDFILVNWILILM